VAAVGRALIVGRGGAFRGDDPASLGELARWDAAADKLLRDFASSQPYAKQRASPVRCWPRHFDIATVFSSVAAIPPARAAARVPVPGRRLSRERHAVGRGILTLGSNVLIHLRVPIVAPLTGEHSYGEGSTPGIYCRRSGVPSGLSAVQLKDVEAVARRLRAKVCPGCLEAKSHEDRLN
jgi:hypothetical protein